MLVRRAGAEAAVRSEVDTGSVWEGAADAVMICAASSTQPTPGSLAATLSRKHRAVVVVGDVRMDVPRAPFYANELDLHLARLYGSGRYDPD